MDQRAPLSSLPPSPPFAGLDREAVVRGPAFSLFTPEDALEIDILNSATGITITVSGEVLGSRLELLPFSFTITPATNRTVTTTRLSVGSGWLQQVRLVITTGSATHGQCFAWVRKCRGTTSNALTTGTFQSGYLTTNTDLFWPSSLTAGPLDGAGALRSITASVPAAGADFAETVPTGARWELIAFRAQLATSAAVANRVVSFLFDDGTLVYFESDSGISQTATQTIRYSAFASAEPTTPTQGVIQMIGLPIDHRLLAGHRIRTLTTNIAAADQWSIGQYLVREWLEGS